MKKPLTAVENLILGEIGRGMHQLAPFVAGDLDRAASELSSANGSVIVVTGFFIASAEVPAAETDGPIGSAVLAAALLASGRQVRIATDARCAPVVGAASRGFGLPAPTADPVILAHPMPDQREDLANVCELPNDISHVIFIERPGRTVDGTYRSMRGTVLDAFTEPLDALASIEGIRTIGLGDGGNEVGMGKLPRDAIVDAVDLGELVACEISADLLILAGCSNWAAHALAAAICEHSCATGATLDGALSLSRQRASLDAALAAGAVDGVRLASAPSVDGLDWDAYIAVPTELNALYEGATP